MTIHQKPSALDSLFDDNDNISNLKLSPTTSSLKDNLSTKDTSSIRKLGKFYNRKKLSLFSFEKTNDLSNNKVINHTKSNFNGKSNWFSKLATTSKKEKLELDLTEDKETGFINKEPSRKNSIRLFFRNITSPNKSNQELTQDENGKTYNIWDNECSPEDTFCIDQQDSLYHSTGLKLIKDNQHGLYPKPKGNDNNTEPNYKINSDSNCKYNLESDEKISLTESSITSENVLKDDFSPLTPPDDKILNVEKMKRSFDDVMDFEDPYKFVFETPNKFSIDESLRLDKTTMDNFRSMWELLKTKDNNNIQPFEEGIMISKLSDILVHLTKTKLFSQENEITSLKTTIMKLEENLAEKNKELSILQKEAEGYRLVNSSIKDSELKMKSAQDEIKQLKSKLNKYEENTVTNRFIQTDKDNGNEIKLNKQIYDQLQILNFYKDETVRFLFVLIERFKCLIPYKNLKQFNERLNTVCYYISLACISEPIQDSQIKELKVLITSFYSRDINTALLNEILTNWPQQIRSNRFLTQKLFELRKQANNNRLPQSINERITREQNKQRIPQHASEILYNSPSTIEDVDILNYY